MVKWVSDKTAADLRYYWGQIKNGNFDQATLASLLVAVREYTAKGNPSREIADFIAHPRRDRWIFLERFESVKFLIDGKESNVLTLGTTLNISVSIPAPLLPTAFTEDLGRTLLALQADDETTVAETISVRRSELTLCYLGLLHYSVLRVNRKSDVVLKITCYAGLNSAPERTLTLRGYRGGTMLLVMTTDLDAAEWCEFIPTQVADISHVRATRRGDGLRLRIC